MATIPHFEKLIAERLESIGYELVELKYIRAGSRSVLRVFIDKQEGGVTIGDCERISTELSLFLDVENFSQAPYTLEISSPGADRVLLTAKDFRRVIGKKVRIRVDESLELKGNTILGTLLSCTEETLQLDAEGVSVPIPLRSVVSGKVELAF